MKKSLQEKIFQKYPNLYKQRFLGPFHSPMAWGLCVGNGWYNLIDDLSQKITDIINRENCNICCEATQVKEKFGGLRFYVEFSKGFPEEDWTDFERMCAVEIDELISKAENESFKICEVCGEEGKTTSGGWISVRCEKHQNMSIEEIRKLEEEEL